MTKEEESLKKTGLFAPFCSSLASERDSGVFHHWNDVQMKAGRAKTTAVEALGGLNEATW